MSRPSTSKKTHNVVIVGGGFGGLYCAQSLKRAPVNVTLIDRRNFHLFQPLLYQVATGGLSPANISAPLRSILKKQSNARVLMDEVEGFDVQSRAVLTRSSRIPYDTLIVAAGASHHYFGNDSWAKHAPGLKTLEDATEIRRRVLQAFEEAERETDPERIAAWLTFVVVGAGPTGVELAGAVAELAHHTLRGNFRTIDPSQARVFLLEGCDRVLPPFPGDLSAKAEQALSDLGVNVITAAKVTNVTEDEVELLNRETTERIPCRTVLWAAGVQASPLTRSLAEATGAELDRAGRIEVQPDLSLAGHPEILVLGDMACCKSHDGRPLPGVAPVAMQQGCYAADLIRMRRKGRTKGPFRYHNKGSMAVIGRSRAVADLGWIRFGGVMAWLAWLFIHLMYLVEFGNRLLVLMQWAWNYFTKNRSARLITFTQQEKASRSSNSKSPRSGKAHMPSPQRRKTERLSRV